jgi:hypothetical protein
MEMRDPLTTTCSVSWAFAAANIAKKLAEPSRVSEMRFLGMAPLMDESIRSRRVTGAVVSAVKIAPQWLPGMQPNRHRADDLLLTARTVPNEVNRSNLKRGLIDDIICIVRIRSVRRMIASKVTFDIVFAIIRRHGGAG